MSFNKGYRWILQDFKAAWSCCFKWWASTSRPRAARACIKLRHTRNTLFNSDL